MNEVTQKIPILLVDDRPENILALQAVLGKTDYLLVEACSGKQALEMLEKYEFAAILLDVQMPIMDGFETAHHIRRNPKTLTTPILFITASLDDSERVYKGYEAGAVDYIFKPFEPLILRSKVKFFVDFFKAQKKIGLQAELLRLQENQERDAFLEYALDAVVGMNDQGQVNYWNKQAEIIFGWSKNESLGLRMSDLIIPEDYRTLHEEGLHKFLTAGVGPILRKRIEVSALKKDGTEFPVELTVIPIKINGSVNFSAFVRDISERRKIDDERRAEREKLKKALFARDEFISICSHELKTPITSMKLQFQLASKLYERNDPQVISKESALKRINSSNVQLDRMARLIDDMLDVSRISSGKLIMNHEPLDLQPIVKEIVDRFSEQLNTLNIDLSFKDLEHPPRIFGDPFRLEQVITNLLTNAIKYGDGNPIKLELENTSEKVIFLVHDQGLGIHQDNIGMIFDRYERAIPSNNISGLGLGLYITRQIVEAHEGHIGVVSELGKGSTFSVEFPILKT